jgi:hypothetical protein
MSALYGNIDEMPDDQVLRMDEISWGNYWTEEEVAWRTAIANRAKDIINEKQRFQVSVKL